MTRLSGAALRRPTPDAPAGSRDRILDAAEHLVAERGYTAASISLISKASGLPASSIYWHFGSKEGLLAAVVERAAGRWLPTQSRWLSFVGDLPEFLRATGQAVSEHPDFVRLLMMLMLDRREGIPAARETMRRVWRDVEERMRHVLADHFRLGDIEPGIELAERLARFIMAFIDGALVDSQIDPEGTPISDLFTDLAVALPAIVAAHTRRSKHGPKGPFEKNDRPNYHRDPRERSEAQPRAHRGRRRQRT
ncbi:MAG TPA: TetR/AcrR family transcriptional regulator [Candidatus Binatia bacterium]|nr:TetR/AcrR family transcriptional regulator [Candidatus Binatia bacterium]